MTRVRQTPVALLLAGSFATALIAGCGSGSHFKNAPRPPVPLELTGVIADRGVSVQPKHFGAGPIVLVISNQTQQTHTVTLEGGPTNLSEQVGPVHPLDTARIQETLRPGQYTVHVSSTDALADIPAATLDVGPERQSSSGTVLLP
jgi:hypothetical protein